jgi:hypothetical protein
MLGTVSAGSCSTAQLDVTGNRGAKSGGGFEVQRQLGATSNSESVLGQVEVEAPRTVSNSDKCFLASAVKLVVVPAGLPSKESAATPYERKDLIARRTNDPGLSSEVRARNEELTKLYEYLDSAEGVERAGVEDRISKLFGQALQLFAKDDGISMARKNFCEALAAQDGSSEGEDKKKQTSDELWRQSVSLIRYVRGGDSESTASLYRHSEHLESNTGVLELRPPGVAPSHLKGFFAQDVHSSISAWLENYNRSAEDSAYTHMSEEQRRNLERNIIGAREIQFLVDSDLAECRISVKDGVFYDSKNNLASTEKHYTNEAGPGWATIVQSTEGRIYIFEHRRSELHHTTISGGKPVRYAGKIKLVEGRVVGLTSKTGHYKTGFDLINKFSAYLHAEHVSHPIIRNYEHSSMIESNSINDSIRAGIVRSAMPRLERAFEKDVLSQLSGVVEVDCVLPFHVPERLYKQWRASGESGLAWLNEYAMEAATDADHAFVRKGVITNSVRYFLTPSEMQQAEVYIDGKGKLLYRVNNLPVDSSFKNERTFNDFAVLVKMAGKLYVVPRAPFVIDSLSVTKGHFADFAGSIKVKSGHVDNILAGDPYYSVADGGAAFIRALCLQAPESIMIPQDPRSTDLIMPRNIDVDPKMVVHAKKETSLPKYFRSSTDLTALKNVSISTEGLAELRASASGQFSQQGLAAIQVAIGKPENLSIIDLRQESHCFVDGHAVTWYVKNGWSNIGLTAEEVTIKEREFIAELGGHRGVALYEPKSAKNGLPPSLQIDESSVPTQSEEEWLRTQNVSYIRLPVVDHLPPDLQTMVQFDELIKAQSTESWMHIHCAGGGGRSGFMMAMYDMSKNADRVPFFDIIKRQCLLGGHNLRLAPVADETHKEFKAQRMGCLATYYEYCKEQLNKGGGRESFSDYVNKRWGE